MHRRPVVQRLAHLAVAVLVATSTINALRLCVFRQFDPIRRDIVSSDQYPSHHQINIPLPDPSSFAGHAAVVTFDLDNLRGDARRIALSFDGALKDRFALPGDAGLTRVFVAAPESPDAVERPGRGGRLLELTGDADDWVLTRLDIRNYRVRVGFGHEPFIVVVPASDRGYGTAAGFLPTAISLSLLALGDAFRRGRTRGRGTRTPVANAVGTAVVLAFVACLVLPFVSPYRLLLSPAAFWVLVVALFHRLLLESGAALVRQGRTHFATVGAWWRRHEISCERGAALLGLSAIGVAQPIFAVISHSPEFFAARGTGAATASAAVVAISFGLPLVLLAIERLLRTLSPRAAALFLSIAIAALATALATPWFVRRQFPPSTTIGVSALAGILVALGHLRSPTVRQFLTALAPAALIVPALFLVDPDVKHSFVHRRPEMVVHDVARNPPIVFVIFDELPLNSLLAADGTIDAERYPNFAALARDAYWFRNATTVSYTTSFAVPAILSGRYPTTSGAVPTLQYYPVNLLTALAGHYEIFESLRFKLCPPGMCRETSAEHEDTVRSLLADLGLVWLHIVLPPAVTDGLPPVTDDWAEFGGLHQAAVTATGRGGVFRQFVAAIDGRPGRVHLIHSMLPHTVLEYVPSGHRYRAPYGQTREGKDPAYAEAAYQRHLAQVGFVDRLVGELLTRLRETGAYSRTLLIVTSDHGASYLMGEPKRVPQTHNLSDILQVPLFVKLPDQRRGEVVERAVETVDIFPTVLDVVKATASIDLDGRSLLDERNTGHQPPTFIWRNQLNAERRVVGDLSADQAKALRRKEQRFGRGSDIGLYAPPQARTLIGKDASAVLQTASEIRVAIRNSEQFANVSLAHDRLPLYVDGILDTSMPAPLTVAVAVNGTIAAIVHSYRDRSSHAFSTLIPENCLRNGRNAVAAFVIEESMTRH